MKIIGLFFMTLVFGIISMITSKKYKLQGDLKELCFPPVFSKILRNRQERRNKKSRKEREQEKRRKKQERDRRKQKNIPTTAQQSIPYIRMLQDGICQVTKTFFSKTIQFYDINYQLALNEDLL